MLSYSDLIPDAVQKRGFLKIAAKAFRDSIEAHKELKSLSSREEFYVFVCAVYKLGITYQCTGTQGSIKKAGDIKEMSRVLYEHYCSFTETILLDKEITDLISCCLRYLHLKQFCDEEDHHARETLINTSGNLDKNDTKGEGGTKTPNSSPLETSDLLGMQPSEALGLADYENILKVHLGGYTVTDKLKEMWQHTEWHDFASEVLNRTLVGLDKNSTDVDALTVDRNSDTKNCVSGSVSGTVNRSIATQDLKQDTASLPNERLLTPEVATIQSQFHGLNVGSSPRRVQGAIVWKFDFSCIEWMGQQTLAFVGEPLDLAKEKEGKQRDAFMVEFLNQEDPFAKYVAKRYKEAESLKQYQQDIICQMTARYYAMLFNQQLTETDSKVGHIEFLPVALLQLVNSNGYLSEVYNVERYMAGDFVKFTNNAKFVRNRGTLVSDLVLAFSHFTHQASNNELIIVDIQGWTPASNEIGCIFLTDPQIHSDVYRCYGTGNLRQEGIDTFWKEMHPECNHLCQKMHLTRPSQQLDNP